MQVPNDRIDEFIDLWERAFGERITRDAARARAHQLVELYRAIAENLTHDHQADAPPPAAGQVSYCKPDRRRLLGCNRQSKRHASIEARLSPPIT